MKGISVLPKKKNYTLVISGGGIRGFYGLGILNGLEELGYKNKIQAIYGVSVGAIIGAYRSAGFSAQEIYDIFFNSDHFNIFSINIFTNKSLLKTTFFEEAFTKNLPPKISDLKIKTYIGTTNVKDGTFRLFNTGDLKQILLGSIALPCIFPVVHYKEYVLMDGGVSNNFPVKIAKKKYPNNDIIGIALNKFQEGQNIDTILDSLSVSFEIFLNNDTVENMDLVKHLFYRDIPLKILDINKEKMHKIFLQGYKDCIKHFKKQSG